MHDVEAKFYDAEILRCLVKEYYLHAVQNPCRYTRGRAGWELHKLNQKYEKCKKELVQLCDQSVSDKELSSFLASQGIQFPAL